MATATSGSATQTGFTPELFKFLRALKRNNDREWFQKNKERYEAQVRDPMLQFITDFAPRLRKISRSFVADPKPSGGSMFRIYRDTRFSKDKSPYKTVASAHFRHERARDVHTPGFYLHLAPGEVFVGTGIWRPDGPSVSRIRDAIVDDPSRWKRVTSPKAFNGLLTLSGESLKRPPRGFDPEHPLIDDLKRKDFTTIAAFTEADACADDFLDRFTEVCRTSRPFMKFLTESLELEF